MALYQVRARQILDAIHSVATLPANSGGTKLRLLTTTPTATTTGTEVAAGGGYAAGGTGITFGAATNGANPPTATSGNSAAVTFTNMPRAETINGIDITDSATTPVPQEFGGLTTAKSVAAGDSLSFAIGAVTSALS